MKLKIKGKYTAKRGDSLSVAAKANNAVVELRVGAWSIWLSADESRELGAFLIEAASCKHCARPIEISESSCDECKDRE